jgi:hypothetical protein
MSTSASSTSTPSSSPRPTPRADGTFDFSNPLPPGTYKVKFTSQDHIQYAYRQLTYDAATTITLTSGATTTVDDQLFWTAGN